MRIDKTKDTEYIRNWRKAKLALGWRHVSAILPVEVAEPLLLYKSSLLEAYRQGKLTPPKQ